MSLVPFMFLRKNLPEPMCLSVSEPLIRERGLVTDDELLATAITPECAHFLEVRRSGSVPFFIATALIY